MMKWFILLNSKLRRITQHKRFVLYGIHSNFCCAKTSFMLETLGKIQTIE